MNEARGISILLTIVGAFVLLFGTLASMSSHPSWTGAAIVAWVSVALFLAALLFSNIDVSLRGRK